MKINFSNLPAFDYVNNQNPANVPAEANIPAEGQGANGVNNVPVEAPKNMPLLRSEDDTRMERLQYTIKQAVLLGKKFVVSQDVRTQADQISAKAGIDYMELKARLEASWKDKKNVENADGTHFEKIALALMTSDEMVSRFSETANPFGDNAIARLSNEEIDRLVEAGLTVEQLIASGKMSEDYIAYVINSNVYDFDTTADVAKVGQKAVEKCCNELLGGDLAKIFTQIDKANQEKIASVQKAVAAAKQNHVISEGISISLDAFLHSPAFIPQKPDDFWKANPDIVKTDYKKVLERINELCTGLDELLESSIGSEGAAEPLDPEQAKAKKEIIDKMKSLVRDSLRRVYLESVAFAIMESRNVLLGDLKQALHDADTVKMPIEKVAKLHTGVKTAISNIEKMNLKGKKCSEMVKLTNLFNKSFKLFNEKSQWLSNVEQPIKPEDYKQFASNSLVSLKHLKNQFEAACALSIQEKLIEKQKKLIDEVWKTGATLSCSLTVDVGVEFGIFGVKGGVNFKAEFKVTVKCAKPYGKLIASIGRNYSLVGRLGSSVGEGKDAIKIFDASLAGNLNRMNGTIYDNPDEYLQQTSGDWATQLLTHQVGSRSKMKKCRAQIELARLNNYKFVQNMRTLNVFGKSDEIMVKSLNKRILSQVASQSIGGSVSAGTGLVAALPIGMKSIQGSIGYNRTTSTSSKYTPIYEAMLKKATATGYSNTFNNKDFDWKEIKFFYRYGNRKEPSSFLTGVDMLQGINEDIKQLRAAIIDPGQAAKVEENKSKLKDYQDKLMQAIMLLQREYNYFCISTWQTDGKQLSSDVKFEYKEDEFLKFRRAPKSRGKYLHSMASTAAALVHVCRQTGIDGLPVPAELKIFEEEFAKEFANPSCKLKEKEMEEFLYVKKKMVNKGHEVTIAFDAAFKSPLNSLVSSHSIESAGKGIFDKNIEFSTNGGGDIGASVSLRINVPDAPNDNTIYKLRSTLDFNITVSNAVSAEILTDILYQAIQKSGELSIKDISKEALMDIAKDLSAEIIASGVNGVYKANHYGPNKGIVFEMIHQNRVSFNFGLMKTKFGLRIANLTFSQMKTDGVNIDTGKLLPSQVKIKSSLKYVSNRPFLQKYGTGSFAGLLSGMAGGGVRSKTWENYALAHTKDFSKMLAEIVNVKSGLCKEFNDYLGRMMDAMVDEERYLNATREKIHQMLDKLNNYFDQLLKMKQEGGKLNPEQALKMMTDVIGTFLEFDSLEKVKAA